MSETSFDLTALYTTERRRLETRISRMIGCRAAAADLVHDLFLRLWDRPPRQGGDPTGYLVRSARNAAIDHLRAERVRLAFIEGTVREQHGAPAPSPHDVLEARQELSEVDAIIRALPERTRHVFLLNRIHGRSYRDIAGALGVSASAVEKHMSRALAAIRDGIAAL